MTIQRVLFTTIFAASVGLACSQTDKGTTDSQQAFSAVPDTDGGTSGNGSSGNNGGNGGANGGVGTGGNAAAAQPSLPVCSDAQVAAILRAVNQGEIDLSTALMDKLQNAEVKAYAQRLITEHSAQNQALAAALSAAGLTAQENGITEELKEKTQQAIAELSQKSGAELDRKFVREEMFDHLTALAMADHILAPSVKNAVLATFAGQARAAIADHAQQAVQLQATLEGQCGGTGTAGNNGNGGGSNGNAGK